MNLKFFIIFFIASFLTSLAFNMNAAETPPMTLQVGDLLFQDLDCGDLCNGIGEVTEGIKHTYISHVGIIESIQNQNTHDPKIIILEAIGPGVVETNLNQFLARSHDLNHQPMTFVERLKPQYQSFIPAAVHYAKLQLGKPYNSTFAPSNFSDSKNPPSFYCSELINFAFIHSSHDQSFFEQAPMNFTNLNTHEITPAWQEYFSGLHAKAPQGQMGSNPGMLSRSDKLEWVGAYGVLRTHQASRSD